MKKDMQRIGVMGGGKGAQDSQMAGRWSAIESTEGEGLSASV